MLVIQFVNNFNDWKIVNLMNNFNKYLIVIALGFSGLVLAASTQGDKSIEFKYRNPNSYQYDNSHYSRFYRCRVQSPTDSLAVCFNEKNGYKEDLFSAMSKCSNMSQTECTAEIAKFRSQISNAPIPVVKPGNDLIYVNYPHCSRFTGETSMTPLEIAVNAGMVKATLGLLQNGAAPDYQNTGYENPGYWTYSSGHYPAYTLLHQLAYQAQCQRANSKANTEIEFNDKGFPVGPSYISKQRDYLEIAKSLVAAAGPTLLDKKGSSCHPSRYTASKVFKTGLPSSEPITATQLCGDAPGAVCDYLREMRPNQVIKEIKDPIKRDEADKNLYGMHLRQTEYKKCSWARPWEYDKNKLSNDQLVEYADAGYSFCE